MINKDRLQQALTYLAETDEECGKLRADHARAEFKAKSINKTIFKNITNGSIADRQAEADTDEVYFQAKQAEFDAFFKYESMKNKRITQTIIVDVWRSLNAGRNKGQII